MDLAPLTQRLTAARADLLAASLDLQPAATIPSKVAAVHAAEFDLAKARADSFAKLQVSANQLTAPQIPAWAATLSPPPALAATGARTSMPHVTIKQAEELLQLTASLNAQTQAVTVARADLVAASLAVPRNDAALQAKADAVSSAEQALASARSAVDVEDCARLCAISPGSLPPAARMDTGGFTEPEPLSFNDHRGYVPLFDGFSLKGWDGNPKFWRAEDEAPSSGNPRRRIRSGNTYIVYRDVEAKDFTLKFEMKIEGDGGSGLQYRSQTGLPWSRPKPAQVTPNVGPVNLPWMMTGPQADFWPSRVYSGQFYSENTPMRIMAWRGQVVEGAGRLGAKRLMGNIGDRTELGKLVKMNGTGMSTP